MNCDNMWSNHCGLTIGIFILGFLTIKDCCGLSVHSDINRQIQSREMDRCLSIEYYDSYVKACNNCSDICWPNNSDISLCIDKCPIYFFHRLNSSLHLTSLSKISTVTNVYSSSDRIGKNLYNNPLFWTSIISMTIAIISIIILVILCAMRKRSIPSGVVRSSTRTRRMNISPSSWFDNMNQFNENHTECLILKQELLNNRQEYSKVIEENYSSKERVTLNQYINPVKSIITPSDSELSIDSGFMDFQIQTAIPVVKSYDFTNNMLDLDMYKYDNIKLYDTGIQI